MSVVHHHWHDFDRTHVRDSVLRLAAGILFIAGVHAAAVYAALNWRQAEAGDPPEAAIMVELAPVSVSETSQVEDVAPGPQMQQSPETTPDAEDIPEEAAPPPEPVVEQVLEKTPEIQSAPAPAEVVLPKPEPVKREVKEPPKKPVERPKNEAKPTRRREAPVTAAAPRSDAPPAAATAAPSQGASRVDSSAIANWRSQVQARVASQKRIPAGVVANGIPRISFVIGAGGRLLSLSLTRSSGTPALDAEILAMARRSVPFPPPPPGVPSGTFNVAVDFKLRR